MDKLSDLPYFFSNFFSITHYVDEEDELLDDEKLLDEDDELDDERINAGVLFVQIFSVGILFIQVVSVGVLFVQCQE